MTMKSGKVATTFCSSTLEMGIDIGSVHIGGTNRSTVVRDCPHSAIGSQWPVGRIIAILRMYMSCREPGPGTPSYLDVFTWNWSRQLL